MPEDWLHALDDPRTLGHMSERFAEQYQDPFVYDLERAAHETEQDDPNYYARLPRSLITTSNVESFITGTGSSIYDEVAPLLEETEHELILVTCFWASSVTRDRLNAVLRKLSDKAVRRGTEKIRVRLCFSSSSVFQKLFHKQTVSGQDYPAAQWVKKFGLPDPSELNGLNLKIKSVFMLPFSVMHPKFIVVDRQVVVLPSCNVSWEEWFEGAITMRGVVVSQFLKFYWRFWERRTEPPSTLPQREQSSIAPHTKRSSAPPTTASQHTSWSTNSTPSLFLPSPHRRNPSFRPLGSAPAPPTPLNTFLLTLFAKAERTIRIQTPNLTAPPVLTALLKALARGIDVHIVTSARLMILEQLVTAGTTTSRCIKKLVKRYKTLDPCAGGRAYDEEVAISPKIVGKLHISFFEPRFGAKRRGEEQGEPQQSHLKMTTVDGDVMVLGSGNLDRASWFTSQELGVAFFGEEVVRHIEETVDKAMEGRSRVIFDSEAR
ncbi:hypothetical protein E8E12_001394 [Didymella heteroderae]|uniref:PLD phosphodiesterase domain-containing protein n=1 Tax=Didymella heteroderae TaxID=1769908 RepID=A0A9P5C2F7_9PLEO|nr:hypothetical protein E8E12_001394 [Didymella heteroderae]